ncbi:efflux RND transporter permease subunit [Aliikangiella coralliicola]|uniref:MMPL family transporter n=1 Tax=Aliikangiella coralliicola TaxID=2592383 RepID=A0A545UJT9_9GAMM|nr:MMPL family transporter [Aliikangiella coralliicola]TQV89729.1 MMPL family transporter [Aliikangiella coralliicola]
MEKYSDFILRNRLLVIAAVLIFVGIAFSGAFKDGQWNIPFKSDYKTFFKDNNKQLNDFLSLQKIYSKSDNVAFIVAPKDGNVFTKETLTAIWELTNEAWQVTYNSRVDSITNFQYSFAEGDDLMIEDLVLEADMLDDELIARAKRVSLSEPILKKKLISENSDAAVVNVTIRLPAIDMTAEVPEVAASVRAIRDDFAKRYPDIQFMLSGMIMMNTSFPEASKADSSVKIPLMLLVVILAVGLLLRTITGTFATLLIILTSVLGTMGIWGWLGGYLTGPSAGSPTVILTLAVADCVHVLSTFYYNMRHGMDKNEAIKDSLRVNMQPVFLTSITTAIGFLTMNFSDAPPFAHLGNMVAIGVMLAFAFSVTIFPAMLSLLPIKVKQTAEHKVDMMDKLANFVIGNRKWLLPVSTVVIIGFASFVPSNQLNDDFVKYFDERVPFRNATDFMQEHLSGMTTLELSFDSNKSSGINDPKFLKFVADFSDWLREMEKTDNVNTITDTLKRLNRNMHGDDPAWYILPDQQELAAQYLLLYELSLPQGLDVNNQLNVDKSSTRVIATFQNLTSNEILELEQKVLRHFNEQNSEYGLSLASPSLMFAHIGSTNIVSMLKGSSLALILISILLGFALRSVKFGLISLIPNLTPAAVGFGVWGLFVGEVGLGLSVVMGVTLGIIVDDTVHFLSKYIRARREKGLSSEDAVRYSFASVGRALWITTMVLIAGFGVMATSSFKVNADMGLLTAVTILIALIIDFLFLPPLLMLLKSKKDKEAEREAKLKNPELARATRE